VCALFLLLNIAFHFLVIIERELIGKFESILLGNFINLIEETINWKKNWEKKYVKIRKEILKIRSWSKKFKVKKFRNKKKNCNKKTYVKQQKFFEKKNLILKLKPR